METQINVVTGQFYEVNPHARPAQAPSTKAQTPMAQTSMWPHTPPVSVYSLPFSHKILEKCLKMLTSLPVQSNPEETGFNMVSMTGRGANTDTPELFQILQEEVGYTYQHLELGTHKVIGHLTDINPHKFVFPHMHLATTIKVYQGVDSVDLAPCLFGPETVHEKWRSDYHLEAKDCYDGFGEPLRDDLEEKICDMGERGYSVVLNVTALFYRENA